MESFRTFSSLELVRANACNRYIRMLHSSGMRQLKLPIEYEIASRWDAYLLCDICRHFASVMLHFASLISHNLRCIPAYAHQIPTGFFQSLLNYHRDNLYVIAKKIGVNRVKMDKIGVFPPHKTTTLIRDHGDCRIGQSP